MTQIIGTGGHVVCAKSELELFSNSDEHRDAMPKRKRKVMVNIIPMKKEETIALANEMIDGLDIHETESDVKQNTKAVLIAALANAQNAKAAHDTAVSTKDTLSAAFDVADANAKAFLHSARFVLAHFLGMFWSQAWMATGFPDQSTAVPENSSGREVLLGALKAYFTTHPAHETAGLNVTAANADTLLIALAAARQAYTEAVADCRTKMLARDQAFAVLRKRMRGLVTELETVLDENDSRWLAFGLNIPGAPATPDMPTGLLATLIGPTAVALKWDSATRAAYYRVFKKVVGVDLDYIAVGSPADLDFTLENLPTNATVEIQISAVNDGGESPRTVAVTVVTHA